MTDQCLRVERRVALRDDHGHDLFLGLGRWHRDHRALEHRREAVDLVFDLHRRNVLAAAADRVLDPVDEVEVAVGVAHQHVTGVVPQVAPRPRGPLRMVPVAVGHDPRHFRPHQRLAGHAVGHVVVEIIDDAHLVTVLGDAATGPVVGELEARARRAIHFGAAPGRRHAAAEAALEVLDLGDQRHDERALERVGGVVGSLRLAIDEVCHRAEQEGAGDVVMSDVGPESFDAERTGQHRGRAADRAGVNRRELPGDVEQRQRRAVDVALVEFEHLGDAPGVLEGVRVAHRHALRRTGRARRVEHAHQVVVGRGGATVDLVGIEFVECQQLEARA